jgi:gliding-associated putative ABC transporter substrate-binding component GldG
MTPTRETPTRGARAAKYGVNVALGIVLFLVILGVVNYLAARSSLRLDLTRNSNYTVTNATREVLKSLKDVVKVDVYATEQGVPAEMAEQRNQLRNLLIEYRTISGNRVSYAFKDPSADAKAREAAEAAGVPTLEMQQMSSSEYSVKAGYFGMVLQYKGKSQTIPVVRPESSLEYQLTNAINKLAQVDVPTVAVIAPAGNPFMGDAGNFSAITKLLQEEGYTVKNVEPARIKDDDLKDAKLAMVLQPEELSEESLYRLDQFVMGGGRLFVAASGVQIDQRSGRANPRPPNINSILESYGVRVDQDMLEDWGKGRQRQFLTTRGTIVRKVDPFAIEATDKNETSPITAKMPGMMFLYASSVSNSTGGTSGTVEPLFRTSERTQKQEQMIVMQPDKVQPPSEDARLESYNLAVQVKGPFQSRFAVVDPPTLTNDDGSTRTIPASQVRTQAPDSARVVVVGSPYSFYDEVLGGAMTNALFILNVADELSRDGRIIALRSKQTEFASLRKVSNAEANTATWLVILGVPVLLVALGLLKLAHGRMKRARYRDEYGVLDGGA